MKDKNFMSDQAKTNFRFGDSFNLQFYKGGYVPSLELIFSVDGRLGSILLHTGVSNMNPLFVHQFETVDIADKTAYEAFGVCDAILGALLKPGHIQDLDGPTVFALLKQVCLYYWD